MGRLIMSIDAFDLNFRLMNGTDYNISLGIGTAIFVLGANGTGKSSLLHRFSVVTQGLKRRVTAHRQTWFSSNTLDITASQKRQYDQQIFQVDQNPDSRWREEYSAQRSSMAIFELIDAQNVRARNIADAIDIGDVNGAVNKAKNNAPLSVINSLLHNCGIPITLSIQKNEEIVAQKLNYPPYSIAQLSDGERNAILICASVLTAPPNTLLLIDEPERHLHRSIISPLLNNLLSTRTDCAFVVSTHDISLAVDSKLSLTLLVRGCLYEGNQVISWDADLVPVDGIIDDDVKTDILGARKKVIFIEGEPHSLDFALYNLIFPNISIIAKRTCREVEHSVNSLREMADLSWLSVWGIIDNDRRPATTLDALRAKGVHSLSCHSVESIYYHPEIIKRVAVRITSVTGGDAVALEAGAIKSAISAMVIHRDRLCAKASEHIVREAVFQHLPTRKSMMEGAPINVSISVGDIIAEERNKFDGAVQASDFSALVTRYPARETHALGLIAEGLSFVSRDAYEASVRKLIEDDPTALSFVRSLFGTLCNEIGISEMVAS